MGMVPPSTSTVEPAASSSSLSEQAPVTSEQPGLRIPVELPVPSGPAVVPTTIPESWTNPGTENANAKPTTTAKEISKPATECQTKAATEPTKAVAESSKTEEPSKVFFVCVSWFQYWI